MASTSRFLRIPTGLTSASTLFPPLSAWSSVPPPQLRPLSASAHREEEIRLKMFLKIQYLFRKIVFTCLFIYLECIIFRYLIKLFDQSKFLLYLGNRHEGDEDNCHNEINPEQPSKEGEVRSHRRAEMRLDLFYAKLPWNQPRLKIHYLSTAILPFLYKR